MEKKVKALQVFENFLKFCLNLESHVYFNNFIKYFLKFATPWPKSSARIKAAWEKSNKFCMISWYSNNSHL